MIQSLVVTPPQKQSLGTAELCPLCSGDNNCRVAKGNPRKAQCWCFQVDVPRHLISQLMQSESDFTCLCRSCLETVARVSREGGDTETKLAIIRAAVDQRKLSREADYYIENGKLVFTAAYHLKRGTCCGSECRHCPY